MNQLLRITRRELYEKVWQTPMQKLANEFGLSDVGLAKLCRRHQIPVPARGYWARLHVGQEPKRPPLPDVVVDRIEIVRHEKRHKEVATRAMPEIPAPRIEVAEDRLITNKHVVRIDKSVLRRQKDERGLPLARQDRMLPVHVSLESLPRALRILDALFTALDSATYTMEWPSPYSSPPKVVVLNEQIGLSMYEIIERKQHKITKEEISRQKDDRWWSPPRWDYAHTGRLRFVLQCMEASHLQHTWSDGKKQKLEDCVGDVCSI